MRNLWIINRDARTRRKKEINQMCDFALELLPTLKGKKWRHGGLLEFSPFEFYRMFGDWEIGNRRDVLLFQIKPHEEGWGIHFDQTKLLCFRDKGFWEDFSDIVSYCDHVVRQQEEKKDELIK